MKKISLLLALTFVGFLVSCAPQARWKNSSSSSFGDLGYSEISIASGSVSTWDIKSLKSGSTTDYKDISGSGTSYSKVFKITGKVLGITISFDYDYTAGSSVTFLPFSKYTIDLNKPNSTAITAD